MKKINVEYGIDRKIFSISDTAVHYEQENRSLQIDAKIETDKKVRAYIKAANGNSDVTDYIQSVEGVYSVFIEDKYMSKGTLYVGFEICGERGYIERLEPLKVYIDSFVNPGEGNADNVYVVTVEIDEVETLSPDGQAYVENVGNKKDVRLKLGIPQGVKGADGKDGYTPVAGKDYYTDEEKAQFLVEVLSTLPVIEDEPNHESSNLITNGAITRFILEKLSQVTNGYDQNYNPLSKNPQSGKAVAQAIAQLLGSAPENLDTLEELAKALQNDESFANKIINMISGKVDKEEGKGLSTNDFTDNFKSMLESSYGGIYALEQQLTQKTLNVENLVAEDVDEDNMTFSVSSAYPLWKPTEEYPSGVPHRVYFKDTQAREMILDLEDRKANVFSMSAKGENINIKDSADSKLNSLKIYGKSKQNKYSGKNLFRILETPQTGMGVTLSYDKTDNAFVLNGTSTNPISFEVVPNGGNYGEIKANDYYTLSFVEVSGSKSHAAHIYVADSVNTGTYFALSTSNSAKKQTKQYTSDCYIKRFAINVSAADITYTNYKFRIQFEKGQSNTEIEPYVGGKASPSPEYPQEINIEEGIKLNIVNVNNEDEKQTLIIADSINGVPVSANGNYTDANGQQCLCDEYNFTTGKKTEWIQTFENLPSFAYQTYNPTNAEEGYYVYMVNSSTIIAYTTGALCNYFTFVENGHESATSGECFSVDSYNIYFKTTIPTLAEFQSWLDAHNVIIQFIKIPEEKDISTELMNAYNELKTYKPVTNIYTLEGAGIDVDYDTDLQSYIDAKFAELQQAIISMGGNV